MFSAESIMLNKDDLLPPPLPLYLNIIGINLSADTEHCDYLSRDRRDCSFQRDACVEYSKYEGTVWINNVLGQHGWLPLLCDRVFSVKPEAKGFVRKYRTKKET